MERPITPREESLLDKCQEKFLRQRQVLIGLQKSLSSKASASELANPSRRNSLGVFSPSEVKRLNERVEVLTKENERYQSQVVSLQDQIKDLSNRSNQEEEPPSRKVTGKEAWVSANLQPSAVFASLLPDGADASEGLCGMSEDELSALCDEFRARVLAALRDHRCKLQMASGKDAPTLPPAGDNKPTEDSGAAAGAEEEEREAEHACEQQQEQEQAEQAEEDNTQSSSACPDCLGKANAITSAALYNAARAGHVACISSLVRAGVDPNMMDEEEGGMSAVMLAAMEGRTESVEALLMLGAGVNVTNKEGISALMVSSLAGQLEPLSLLLRHHAHVDAADDCGAVALMGAAEGGHVTCVQALVDANAAVNAVDEAGSSALTLAAAVGNEEVLRVLLGAAADVTLKDKQGTTALMAAEKGGHVTSSELLRAAGATT